MQEQVLAVDLNTEQTLEVNLPEQDNIAQIDVYWQDEVTLDLDASLMYIVSGQKEIQDYVDNKSKPEIDQYIETYAKPIVAEVVEQEAAPVIDEYFEGTVKPSITEFANTEMAGYAQTATEQVALAKEQADRAEATASTVSQTVEDFNIQTEATKNEFIAFVNDKTVQLEEVASSAAAEATDGAEHSRIWAEGEQAEVETLGGEFSSRGFADFAMAIANTPEDVPLDQSKLLAMSIVKGPKGDKGDKGEAGKDGVDGKDGLETFATNCITEIPQDIKLELKDGVLTLKAGSKVYVPNGDGNFDVVTVASDKVVGQAGTVSGAFAFYRSDINDCYSAASHHIYSGATAPSDTAVTATWYDTTNNVIKVYDGTAWRSGVAFPLCSFTNNNSSVTSIDQVFNGFGYIGSTVFALPNVKGLIPNGRNEDGTLRNIEFVVDEVIISTQTNSSEWINKEVLLTSDKTMMVTTKNYTVANDGYLYNPQGTRFSACVVGSYSSANTVISNFSPKLPFRAVDYSDSSWVAAQAMPSNKYIDLTLGASGSSYTAPANGWFYFSKKASASEQWFQLSNKGKYSINLWSSGIGQSVSDAIECLKGDVITVSYTLGGTTDAFRFIYAEGDK